MSVVFIIFFNVDRLGYRSPQFVLWEKLFLENVINGNWWMAFFIIKYFGATIKSSQINLHEFKLNLIGIIMLQHYQQ